MITYNLTNTGSEPLYIFLYQSIKNDILRGVLKPGERLPSKRTFAANQGVSVMTVENAYARLITEGYVYSLPKRGFYVADLRAQSVPPERAEKAFSGEMAPLTGGGSGYFADFSSNQTSSDLFPFTIWSKVIREVLSDSRVPLMTNSPCGGVFALREVIARYLRDFRGMSVRPEQIIIGAGTEYLYGLLIQLLGRKTYAVENPGYRKPERIYRSFRMPCAWVPLDEAGIRVPELEASGADIVHITPSHQYPTGIIMPISRRYELLAWASKREGRYIIEDDYDSELRLSGRPLPTLQSIDLSGKVIYMNTFAKTLCSTVRISYMILPPGLLDEFYKRLSFYSCTVSNFEQYTLARFIEEGKFETHLNRLRTHYRKKRDVLLESLQNSRLAPLVSVSGAEAGFHFLLTVRAGLPQQTLLERAQAKGIRLVPLSGCAYGDAPQDNVYVMNYSSIDVTRADEIWRRLYECTVPARQKNDYK